MISFSAFEYAYLWFPIIGLIVGFLGSFTGGGGGFIYIPLLTILFGLPAQVAISSSLAATLPICIVGAYGHYKKKNLDLRIGLIFAGAGILGALLGARVTGFMTARMLRISFGIYSILIALVMYLGQRKDKKALANGGEPTVLSKTVKFTRSTLYGFLSGVITATFGTSGTAPILAGLMGIRMPLKLVLGTSLLVVFFNTCSALGAHFLVGEIDLTIVAFLLPGSVLGAFLGPRLLANIKIDKAEGKIRQWYALGMVISGVLMIVL
ncbi:MAG: sulfite exporter TauE/SafE family protein [Bacteroidales bacterium]|nr:sulfite exporter TauE/SafE family protein [Bacteroidales bacterium]MDD3522164.1 sulfite exporter TauE/SafE family protein [Bacteroidales bacterium]MDD4029980.1 sulfite exporter TauE/SafE family protein [Bacteroidales bacterium]MDD4434755.1 sulfite exporter TauE/SafE family protein [Bacteroidales bacterium]MDD5732708.1 sulfite exporter TauE/SafE family protein [Bacteroidales bacterium]